MDGFVGSYDSETGKFFYLGSESLTLPEVEEIVPEEETDPEEAVLLSDDEEDVAVTADYVVLTATFKVLKSGTHNVSVTSDEYYNLNKYLNVVTTDASVDVLVVMSDDNTLSYLEVAGNVIELVEGVFEYALTVKNEVTLVDLKYTLSNVAASVVSTISPEELVVGDNEITIIVVSESGLTQDYKVVVTREEAVKETTKVTYTNNDSYYEKQEEVEPVTPVEPTEPTEEKESNLSKIVIMVLIVLVIGGLVYLIFRDDEETDLSTNKKLNNLKKEDADFEVKEEKTTKTKKDNNKKPDSKKNANNKKR